MKLRNIALACAILFVLLCSPLSTLANTPDMHFSFENGFACDYIPNNSLISYGTMAFESVGATGKALDLKTEGYLRFRNSQNIEFKDSFTFATWVNFHEMTCGYPMFLSRTASNGDLFNGPLAFAITDDYKQFKLDLTFQMADGEYVSHSFYSDPFIDPWDMMDKWHHIAVTFDKTVATFYFDGVIVSTAELPEELNSYISIANNRQPLNIGLGFGTNITAILDEIHFCTRALPYEEVAALRYVVVPAELTKIIVTEGYNTVWVNDYCHYAPDIIRKDSTSGELMIPAKAVMQHMGATFNWDGNDRMGRLDIHYKGKTISAWIMDVYANENGNRLLELPCAPANYSDSIFIPASLLSEGFGIDTEWNEELKQLTITF